MSESKKISMDEAADLFVSLSNEKKAAVMALVSYELTVAFRGISYDLSKGPETEIAARLQKRLAGINELQHQVTDRLMGYFDSRVAGKPDKDLFTGLLRMATAHEIPVAVENALLKGLSRYGK